MKVVLLRVLLCSSPLVLGACGGAPPPAAEPAANPDEELTEHVLTGTGRAPEARGTLSLERHQGEQIVSIELENLPPPTRYADSMDSYVVWFIAPDDRAHRMGVLTFDREQRFAQTMTTTSLDRFHLRITAEQGADVPRPSDVVVVQHQVGAPAESSE